MSDDRRTQLLELVKKEFIGPDPIEWPGYKQANGEEILVSDPPRTRYIAGILYPQETPEDETSAINENEMEDASAEEEKTETDDHPAEKLKVTNEYLEVAEELINRSNAYRQSAISITVGIHKDDSISVDVSAGRYTTLTSTDPKTEKVVSQYLRKQITWNNEGRSVNLPLASDGILRIPVGETMLCFDPVSEGRLSDLHFYAGEFCYTTSGIQG